ncbi:ATP-dependent RNA helicase DHX30-like [Maniola hyperantus]|uniref:ATP-dependent RNA helicase DHX30-like n=1 Tax=Aphantopus hyperantus TaxID=2795564 RepID=UPI001568C0FE|nr:ATP-dependent RNA helicase DHX30-like [Maniola hyperantus]
MLGKYIVLGRLNLRKRIYLRYESPFKFISNTRYFSGYLIKDDIKVKLQKDTFNQFLKYSCGTQAKLLQTPTYSVFLQHRKWVSKGLIDDIFKEENVVNDKVSDLTRINEIFTQPRVTLHGLASKSGQKVFDIHYKQTVVAPKGGNKKPIQNDWTCTYTFVWPEKAKFESTAVSKRQAAEKAAMQALQWLYKNGRIDNKGTPIHDKNVLQELRSTLNKPLHITLSDTSVQRINRIWIDYETEIKSLYETTFKEANQKLLNTNTASILTKDSTIDEQDYTEDVAEDEFSNFDEISDLKSQMHPVFGKHITPASPSTLARRERTLQHTFSQYDENLTPLPIDQYAEQITSTLEKSRVAVIVGAAGCGKSTRVPAAILRHGGVHTAAIVSEPRRVAAIGLAQRVADELGEHVGESVGYQVRLHAKLPRPPGGAILYCTSGVLLRRLQLNPGLEGCTHVFIDEAHERDVNTDVTLLLLKRALDINPSLKIVVMSATLDTAVFTRYFDECPVVEVPGRTFPVTITHLEEIQKKLNVRVPSTLENSAKEDGRPQVYCQEVVDVIKAVDKTQSEGAILVFLPGWAEIKQAKLFLEECYKNSALHMVLPVHSRLSTTEQTKMFSKPPPGVRKIVLATNIAETSITIPDVVYVIDSGAQKENRIREGTGNASLETVWVSQAGAKQRAGRAGRVQPGHCYKMYTKEKENEFAPHTTPEILRIPLEQTVLDCKTYAPDDKVENFLSELPEPPSKQAIRFAVNDLIDLGALTPSERLTRLGVLLSSMTLHPRLARCVLNAAVVGGVVAAANVATHCADNVELFRHAADRREEIREIKRKFSATSDHAALHWIQDEFEQRVEESGWEGVDRWCEQYGLRKDRLSYVKSISNLHLEHLLKTGLIEKSIEVAELNRFSSVDELTAAVLLSGSNALLLTRKYVKTKGKLMTVVDLFTSKGDRAHIGSESVNYGISKRKHNTQLLTYFGGYHSLERRALVVHKTSLISPHTALLFSMGQISKDIVDGSNGEVTEVHLPRHRLKIQVPTSQAEQFLQAREMLWNTLQYYIERDLSKTDFDDVTKVSRFKTRLVKALGRILVEAAENNPTKNNISDTDNR